MGFELMVNFRRPYFAASIADFWRRWHISLSTWFRDYLYISLGGNRAGTFRTCRNLMIVFLISGLWHGASWLFVVWGALHGLYFILAQVTAGMRERTAAGLGLARFPSLQQALGIVTTFAAVCFAWIFFRAQSFHDATYIATHLFSGFGQLLTQPSVDALRQSAAGLGLGMVKIALLSIVVLEVFQYCQEKFNVSRLFVAQPALIRWAGYYAAVMWILLCGNFDSAQFIYFQF
jgi:D-alanyl-lipoteichoic acid acyltransferase DltB (MBOAT superfamily)